MNEKPTLTKKQLGELRRAYITMVYGTVRACGHKFDPKRQPKNNCQSCWEAYFMAAVDTAAIHDDFQKGGKARLRSVYGDKFTKNFGIFLENQLLKEAEHGEADRVQMADSNDGSSDGEVNESPYELGVSE